MWSDGSRRLLPAGLVVALVVVCGCLAAAGLSRSSHAPPFAAADPLAGDPSSSVARMEGYFPNTLLTTHTNQKVRFYDDLVRGKCVLINFMYTRCDGI